MPRITSNPTPDFIIESISNIIPPLLNDFEPEDLAVKFFKDNIGFFRYFMTRSKFYSLYDILCLQHASYSDSPQLKRFYLHLISQLPSHFSTSGEADDFITSRYNAHNLSILAEDIASTRMLTSYEENENFMLSGIKLDYSISLTFSNLIFFLITIMNKLTRKKDKSNNEVTPIISSENDTHLTIILLTYCSISMFTTMSYIGTSLCKLDPGTLRSLQALIDTVMPKYFIDYFRYCMNVSSPLPYVSRSPVVGGKLEHRLQEAKITIYPYVSDFFKFDSEMGFINAIKLVAQILANTLDVGIAPFISKLESFNSISELNSLLGRNLFDFSTQNKQRFGPLQTFLNNTILDLPSSKLPTTDFTSGNLNEFVDFMNFNTIICIVCFSCDCDMNKIDEELLNPEYSNRLPDFLFNGFLDCDGNVIAMPSWDYLSSTVESFAYDLTLMQVGKLDAIKELNASLIKYNNYLITSSNDDGYFVSLLNRLEKVYFGNFISNAGYVVQENALISLINIYQPPSSFRTDKLIRGNGQPAYVYDAYGLLNGNYSGVNAIQYPIKFDSSGRPSLELQALRFDNMPPFRYDDDEGENNNSDNVDDSQLNNSDGLMESSTTITESEKYERESTSRRKLLNEVCCSDEWKAQSLFIIIKVDYRTILDKQKRFINLYSVNNSRNIVKVRNNFFDSRDDVTLKYNMGYLRLPILTKQGNSAFPELDIQGMRLLLYYVMTIAAKYHNHRHDKEFRITLNRYLSDFHETTIAKTFEHAIMDYCMETDRPQFVIGGNLVEFADTNFNTNPDALIPDYDDEYYGIWINKQKKKFTNPNKYLVMSCTFPSYCRMDSLFLQNNEVNKTENRSLIRNGHFEFVGQYEIIHDRFYIGGAAIKYIKPNYNRNVSDENDSFNLKIKPYDDRDRTLFICTSSSKLCSEIEYENFEHDTDLFKWIKSVGDLNRIRISRNENTLREFLAQSEMINSSPTYLYNRSRYCNFTLAHKHMKKFLDVVMRKCRMKSNPNKSLK